MQHIKSTPSCWIYPSLDRYITAENEIILEYATKSL